MTLTSQNIFTPPLNVNDMEKIEEMRVMRAIISAVLNNRKIVPGSELCSSSVCNIDDFDIEVMEKYLERWNQAIAEQEKEQADKAIQNQWNDLKAKHPDVLLLLRIGDFYVMYNQDAEIASEILGITLSKHSNSKFKEQAGFPYHALDTYLPKLIRGGQQVAICDILEKPKQQKRG